MLKETVIGEPYGNCPVQSSGLILGHPYYFRSRGDHWVMWVSNPGEDPVTAKTVYSRSGYVGPWPEAGWITEVEAKRLVMSCAGDFVEGARGEFLCFCDGCDERRKMLEECQRLKDSFREFFRDDTRPWWKRMLGLGGGVNHA